MCAAAVALVLAEGTLERVTRTGVLFLAVTPVAGAIALVYVALRLWDSAVQKIALELSILGVSLIAVEALIAVWAPDIPSSQLVRKQVADKLGVPFDIRSVSDVVAQLRGQGIDALPGISREWPRLSEIRARLPDGFYPLSHASRATVVECNERGEYLLYDTDEFGFNNPPGLLASRRIDIAAIGESYTLGHCLPQQQSLVGRLRGAYPRTANFGLAGSRTLSMLGSFREYVEPLRPPVVLWVVNPHFVVDEGELQDPVLTRYLQPGFSQRLLERQSEVDRVIRSIAIPAQEEFDRTARLAIERAAQRRFTRIPFGSQLRARLRQPLWRAFGGPDLGSFIESLGLASETTRRWGGDFVVLIVPIFAEVVARDVPPTLGHEHLARVLSSIGIPVIDAVDFFLGQRDPAALYTMRINNHPTPEGYALLADYVIGELERRFPTQVANMRHAMSNET